MATTTDELVQKLEDYEKKFDELSSRFEILHAGTDAFFLVALGIIIFLMQGGFALLEAGAVRTKNTVNILIKNILDCLLGGLAYWAVGWAFAYGPGGNGFIGASQFLFIDMPIEKYAPWFFQYVFAATAATIISGAIAERCQLGAYFVYSILITGWVYPPVSHWAWDSNTPGWLFALNYQDFAGSGAVHVLSGVCALVGCIAIGPRKGRFDAHGNSVEIPGHSLPLAALGGFILLFGFLAFNGGSQLAIASDGDAAAVTTSIINTILGGCGGGLTVLFSYKFALNGKWSYMFCLNGTLAGMVATCSGCNVMDTWAAIIAGVIGGFAYILVHFAMIRCKFDDPLDAVAVHAGGGYVGVIMVKLFDPTTGIFYSGNEESWKLLGINLLGVAAITAWTIFWSVVIFVPLRYFNFLRIDEETELEGCDLIKHGESAYPASSWVEKQYDVQSGGGMPAGNGGGGGGTGRHDLEMAAQGNAGYQY